jgi:hypothetical protein
VLAYAANVKKQIAVARDQEDLAERIERLEELLEDDDGGRVR